MKDVRIVAQTTPYQDFFRVIETHLTHRRFDGSDSAVIKRAAFMIGDAVTVLPFDPVRRRVLLIEQFRIAPLLHGGPQGSYEAIAGRVDPGEDPETTARREAREEAGLTLGALHKVAAYYPSPGAVCEFITSYVAICDLPDGIAGVYGLASESEDIRGHLVDLDDLLAMVSSGAINNAPLILTAQWLALGHMRGGLGSM